jgi:hypothetical protein
MGVMNFGVSVSNQTVLNNMTAITEQSCVANCTSYESGDFVVIRNTTVSGDLNVGNQTCSADASCVMTAQQTAVNDLVSANSASTQQTNATDLFNDFSITYNIGLSVSNTTSKNSMTQVQSSTCAANSNQSSSGNFIYVNDADVGGDFNAFNQSGSATANCMMSNTSNMQNYNKLTTDAGVTQTNIGMMSIVLIVLIVGVLGLGGIFLFMYLNSSVSSNKLKDCGADAVDCNDCCDSDPCKDPCPQCLPDGTTKCKAAKSPVQSATSHLHDFDDFTSTLSSEYNKYSGDVNALLSR